MLQRLCVHHECLCLETVESVLCVGESLLGRAQLLDGGATLVVQSSSVSSQLAHHPSQLHASFTNTS